MVTDAYGNVKAGFKVDTKLNLAAFCVDLSYANSNRLAIKKTPARVGPGL